MSNSSTSRPYYKASSQFRPWTKIDDHMLIKMVNEGKNSEQIAESLGRTRAAVMGRKSHLGVKQRMAPARGSKMPYIGFSKESRSKTIEEEDIAPGFSKEGISTPAPEVPAPIIETPRASNTIGSSIDEIFAKAKAMGLKVKISISTEDQD